MRAPSVFVPPRATPMTRFSPTRGGYDTSEVGGGEKPYRVYRGGRATGAVPLPRRKPAPQVEKRASSGGKNGAKSDARPGAARPRRKRRSGRYIALGLLVLVLLGVLLGVATYFA